MKDCMVCIAIHRVPIDDDCGHDPAFTNLHLQLEPGEVVLDGEPELQRVIAEVADGQLRLHREHFSLPDSGYPDGIWRHDYDWGGALGAEATRRLAAMLTRCEPASAGDNSGASEAMRIARWVLSTPFGEWPYKHDELVTLAQAVLADGRDAELTATTEQLDVYRSRCQQLAGRIAKLEAEGSVQRRRIAELEAADEEFNAAWVRAAHRINELTTALLALIARIRSVGGYTTPEEQDVLREAELVCGD